MQKILEAQVAHAGCRVPWLQLTWVQMAPGLPPDLRLQMVRALKGPRMLRALHPQTLVCSWPSAAGSTLAAESSL